MKRINLGILGCGKVVKYHLQALDILREQYNLIGVYDTDHAKADTIAKDANTKAYDDIESLLADTDINTVAICTPSGFHCEHGEMVARANKNCLIEKPIGLDLESVDKMLAAFEETKARLFIITQSRLSESMRLLRKALDKKRFGKLYFIVCNVFWNRPQSYYDADKWRGTKEYDGGLLLNQANHYLDAMLGIGGYVESVQGCVSTLGREIEIEDTASATLRFTNGAIGSINCTILTYPKNYEASLLIVGEKGMVKLGGTALGSIQEWTFAEYDDDDKEAEALHIPPARLGHSLFYQQVYNALVNNRKTEFNGAFGRRTLELALAIYKSSETGQREML